MIICLAGFNQQAGDHSVTETAWVRQSVRVFFDGTVQDPSYAVIFKGIFVGNRFYQYLGECKPSDPILLFWAPRKGFNALHFNRLFTQTPERMWTVHKSNDDMSTDEEKKEAEGKTPPFLICQALKLNCFDFFRSALAVNCVSWDSELIRFQLSSRPSELLLCLHGLTMGEGFERHRVWEVPHCRSSSFTVHAYSQHSECPQVHSEVWNNSSPMGVVLPQGLHFAISLIKWKGFHLRVLGKRY